MKLNRLIIVSLFALAILTVGAVSAAGENATSEDLTVSEDLSLESSAISSDEVLSADEGVLSEVSSLINSIPENGTLELEKDYKQGRYVSKNGITISKPITIDGNGHTLDAKGKSRIFNVAADNVTLKNIVFKNGHINEGGGAIYCEYVSHFVVENCSFVNCSSSDNFGGAIHVGSHFEYVKGESYWVIDELTRDEVEVDNYTLVSASYSSGSVFNCSFVGCNAYCAGAIYWRSYGNISSCSFVGCNAFDDGGAISIWYDSCILNCSFSACHADHAGGAVDADNEGRCRIFDSSFVGCDAEFAGAIYGLCDVTKSSFVDCSAETGGAIYGAGDVAESSFAGCHAYEGGAIYTEEEGNIISCNFTSCHADTGGAVRIFSYGGRSYNRIVDCSFVGCRADEGGSIAFWGDASEGYIKGCSFLVLEADSGTTINANGNVRIVTSNFKNNKPTEWDSPMVEGGIVFDCVFVPNTNSAVDSEDNYAQIVSPNMHSDQDGFIVLRFPRDAKGSVKISINGNNAGSVKLSNGIVKFDARKFIGKCAVTFEYSGDANYPAFTKKSTVTIAVVPTVIKAKDASALYLSGKKYSLTVYEKAGKLAKNAKVVVKVDGDTFKTLKTNAKGVASFKITQAPGKYELSIVSLGRTVTKALTVKHLVSLKTVTVKKSAKKLTLQASLVKVNGKYLNGKKVVFKFNGKKYKATTNSKGVAKVTIKSSVLKKLTVGKKVTYRATYMKDTVKKTVTVKK